MIVVSLTSKPHQMDPQAVKYVAKTHQPTHHDSSEGINHIHADITNMPEWHEEDTVLEIKGSGH